MKMERSDFEALKRMKDLRVTPLGKIIFIDYPLKTSGDPA